jgi:predicted transcriptional regulator
MAKPARSADSTVRVDRATSGAIARLAQETGLPRKEIVALAVERLRRDRILASANAGFAAMKKDSGAWREELEERASWETTLVDGLRGE